MMETRLLRPKRLLRRDLEWAYMGWMNVAYGRYVLAVVVAS